MIKVIPEHIVEEPKIKIDDFDPTREEEKPVMVETIGDPKATEKNTALINNKQTKSHPVIEIFDDQKPPANLQ